MRIVWYKRTGRSSSPLHFPRPTEMIAWTKIARQAIDQPLANPTHSYEKKDEEKIEIVATEFFADPNTDGERSPPPELTPELEKKLYRKIDLWLMPILGMMYLSAFLDRGIYHLP